MIQAGAPVGTPLGADSEMRDLLLGAIPALRAFAFSLTYDSTAATTSCRTR